MGAKKNGDDGVWEEQVCQNRGSVNEYFGVVSPVVRKKKDRLKSGLSMAKGALVQRWPNLNCRQDQLDLLMQYN